MSMSTICETKAVKKLGRPRIDPSNIGLCAKCGHKMTFCGKPFTAEIPCSKCMFINIFIESKQPVGGHW